MAPRKEKVEKVSAGEAVDAVLGYLRMFVRFLFVLRVVG
jgi:hypothetical protein